MCGLFKTFSTKSHCLEFINNNKGIVCNSYSKLKLIKSLQLKNILLITPKPLSYYYCSKKIHINNIDKSNRLLDKQ